MVTGLVTHVCKADELKSQGFGLLHGFTIKHLLHLQPTAPRVGAQDVFASHDSVVKVLKTTNPPACHLQECNRFFLPAHTPPHGRFAKIFYLQKEPYSMDNDDHPVIRAMRLNKTIRPHDLSYLLKHGRPYKGAELPPGTETWGRGKCIPAAEALARRYGWKFRVGFALPAQSMVGTDRQPLYHAWNTPDDEVAFDAVWPDPVHTDYFGLPRIHEPRVEKMLADKAAMRKHGHACDLLTGAFERDLKRALRLF